MQNQFIYTLKEIEMPVLYLRKVIEESSIVFPVILLTGEMGAGKTTFVSHFVKSYERNLNSNSPTYNLMNEYKTSKFSIFHFDLYRLKSSEEIENLGFEEIWGKQGLSIIEWWKIAESYLDIPSILVQIEILNEFTRKIQISLR